MGLVKPIYKTILPHAAGEFELQWTECLDQLTEFLDDRDYNMFRICVFVHVENDRDYKQKAGLIISGFTSKNKGFALPVSVIPQSPELPFDVAVELGMYEAKHSTVEHQQLEGVVYSKVMSHSGIQELWLMGTNSDVEFDGQHNPAIQTFEKLKSGLDKTGLSFNSVVRQWNYVGRILNISGLNGQQKQHYQIFNEARNSQYSQNRTLPGFPAATGIGMNSNRVAIDCLAISNEAVEVIAISNPNQKESYHYGQEVLVGEPRVQKQPPQFERAILLKAGNSCRLIISGTASIVGQHTIGIGDVELQTKITIDNIERLTSVLNLRMHCPDLECFPEVYSHIRVYIKDRNDIQKVKRICTDHFGNIPATYVQAEICRDDLLVEIEAEKINV